MKRIHYLFYLLVGLYPLRALGTSASVQEIDSTRRIVQKRHLDKREFTVGLHLIGLLGRTAEVTSEWRTIRGMSVKLGGGGTFDSKWYIAKAHRNIINRETSGHFIRADARLYPFTLLKGAAGWEGFFGSVGIIVSQVRYSALQESDPSPFYGWPARQINENFTAWGVPFVGGIRQDLGRKLHLELAAQATIPLNERPLEYAFIPGQGVFLRFMFSVHYKLP